MAHLQGDDDGIGFGVEGTSKTGIGAFAWSENSVGLAAFSGPKPLTAVGEPFPAKPPTNTAIYGYTLGKNAAGVVGQNVSADSYGVLGTSHNGTGIFGISTNGSGVHGETNSTICSAVSGLALNPSSGNPAVSGEHRGNGPGVYGQCDGNGAGVVGQSTNGPGVHGKTGSNKDSAVFAEHTGQGIGVFASGAGAGVVGLSTSGPGVHGKTSSDKDSAVFAEHTGQGIGVFATSARGLAGFFQGDVTVTGDIRLLNADCAEDFDVSETEGVEPGTVMVLDEEGALEPSHQAYDKRVAGVISGAGAFRPGIVLDKRQTQSKRMPIALLGKVYCKIDAQYSPVGVGDLLTTSPTPGHAMKADDPLKAFGAVIGKALRPLRSGQELVPILIALQ
jgi:hypothetical protein